MSCPAFLLISLNCSFNPYSQHHPITYRAQVQLLTVAFRGSPRCVLTMLVSSCLLIFAELFCQSGEPSPNIPLIWGSLPSTLDSLLKRSLLLEATSNGSFKNGVPAVPGTALTCFSSVFPVEGSTPGLGDLVYCSFSKSHESDLPVKEAKKLPNTDWSREFIIAAVC